MTGSLVFVSTRNRVWTFLPGAISEAKCESKTSCNAWYLVLVDRLHPEWTVAAVNEVLHHQKADMSAARVLGACPARSTNWRETLARRVLTGAAARPAGRLDGLSG